MAEYTMYVGIGRNMPSLGNAPMADEVWETFKARIRDLSAQTEASLVFAGEGRGLDEHGIPEESYLAVISGRLHTLLAIRDQLPHIGWVYSQRTIAVTLGKPDFVAAS